MPLESGLATPLNIGVFGAGAVGCYLGTRLSAAGCSVALVGRGALVADPSSLRAVDLGGRATAARPDVRASADPAILANVDVCLVTVKSQDTQTAGAVLGRVLRPSTIVVSFQNGIGNAALLRDGGLACTAVPGMIAFNVIREGDSGVRQTTSGPLSVGASDAPGAAELLDRLVAAFARTGLRLTVRADIDAVLAGKLLINLGNGVSAATGLPTAEALRSRDYRWCLAQCIREGFRVFRWANMPVRAPGGLSPALAARVLDLPTAVFKILARPILTVDPLARSSTLQDLDRGKPTEIDYLNGAIAQLAERIGTHAPRNAWITNAVHGLERAPRPIAWVPVATIRAEFERLGGRGESGA